MAKTPQQPACADCGMIVKPQEYHPYAACIIYKATRCSSTTRDNLLAVRAYERQQTEARFTGAHDQTPLRKTYEGFTYGVMASLEHIRIHNQPVIAKEIVEACLGSEWRSHIANATARTDSDEDVATLDWLLQNLGQNK